MELYSISKVKYKLVGHIKLLINIIIINKTNNNNNTNFYIIIRFITLDNILKLYFLSYLFPL